MDFEKQELRIHSTLYFYFSFCVRSFQASSDSLAILSGFLVTTAWRVLRLRMEEKASRYGG
jgi:hypothetical protein